MSRRPGIAGGLTRLGPHKPFEITGGDDGNENIEACDVKVDAVHL